MTKDKRDYIKEYHKLSTKRLAKCGHWSEEGRWYKCENCKPKLDEIEDDYIYFDEYEGSE